MNKLLMIFSSLFLITSSSYAIPPLNTELMFECPHTAPDPKDPDEGFLTNTGAIIHGPGDEWINSKKLNPYHPIFSGVAIGNIPINLQQGGYDRSGAFYLSLPGVIQCHYYSTLGFDSFDVFLVLNNGLNGIVSVTTNAFIKVKLSVG